MTSTILGVVTTTTLGLATTTSAPWVSRGLTEKGRLSESAFLVDSNCPCLKPPRQGYVRAAHQREKSMVGGRLGEI
ncbi:MAG TPA: hypothetical protein VMP13_03500 [Acidimicrobiia bacterium]|nr:hypothetical protein [Acidimicrobiia bacterium]